MIAHSGVQAKGSNPKGLSCLGLLDVQGAEVRGKVSHLSSPHGFSSEATFVSLSGFATGKLGVLLIPYAI